MKIILYDDHQFVTEAISSYLMSIGGFDYIGQSNSIDELKSMLGLKDFDVAVLDILSDEDAGFSNFYYILQNYPKVKIIAYSSITSPFIVDSLMNIGLFAFVNKRESLDFLLENIRQAYEQDVSIPEISNEKFILTPREKELVLLLKDGMAAKEIAFKFGTSINTVNNQKNTLLNKFQCANSTELVIKLSQLGFINIL